MGQIHGQGYGVYGNVYSCKKWSVCIGCFDSCSREISIDNAKEVFFLGLRGVVYNGSDCEALFHRK